MDINHIIAKDYQLLIVTIATGFCLVLGFDALGFGAFSALGLRTSRFDFFCDFATGYSSAALCREAP
jgi:hypothetical protein